MGTKNLGPAVSGYLDPDGRSFESVAFQAGKPVLDKELNLSEDLDFGAALGLVRKLAPSGWLTNDHLNKSDPTASLFVPSVIANTLVLANNLTALVNGWSILLAYTGSATTNTLSLGAGPAGNGAKRTDIVILEVWRRLISASPSTVGKSPTGRIWRNGNVKIQAADDAVLNFADDILDAIVASETTKRVQIQYRIRVIPGVDIFAYPNGIDDPVVLANSVPPSAGAPNGVVTAFVYQNQSANGDPGLWRAGDGLPTNTIDSVDGYMYAIPLVAVFRRNTTAFSRNLNHNGGVASPGPSDRPDGLLYDIFVANDVADLRQATSITGWGSYLEVGEKNFNYLLDNSLKTEWEVTALGGGVAGHTLFWADEIGTLPGDGVLTGDTPGAEFLGQFDCTRRFFSDRVVYEVLTFQISPGDPNVSTATWATGTVVTINPAAMAQYPFSGAIGFISRAPSGTRIVDVVGARIHGTVALEKGIEVGFSQASPTAIPLYVPFPVTSISGLGQYPPGNVFITLGTPPIGGLTTEPMYIDLLIGYPPGVGLTKTPTDDFGTPSFYINNPGPPALPATAPVSFSSMQTQAIDAPHREVQLQYKTSTITHTMSADSGVATSTKYVLPERVETLIQVRINGGPLPGAGGSLDVKGRLLTLSGGTAAPGDIIDVDYQAIRPMPQSSVQMTIYYEARAAQTVRSALLGTSLTMVPRWISPFLYSITTGSGSQGEGYPYPFAYVQTGGIIKVGGGWSGEHELDGDLGIFVAEFNASTGFLRTHSVIPYVPNPEAVTFTRGLIDADIENRTYFPSVPTSYKPNAFGQPLSDERIHKVVMPTIMETTSDSVLAKKGTLFQVLLVRWAEFDAENSVKFLAANNTTIASVFRLSGNLLNRRSS
jgi:hypothetical protein